MPPAIIANRAVHQVIHERDDAGAVAQERPPPRHAVQHAVQPQLGRRVGGTAVQAFGEAPCAAEGERAQVGDAGAVAEVVGPAARGEGRLRAGEGGERRVFEREVVERVRVEVGERV